MTPADEKYIRNKMKTVMAILIGLAASANFVGINYGRCTDGVINARNRAYDEIEKIIKQIVKRLTKTT